MAFKLGDIVQLKSGGPKMTVTQQFNDGSVQTFWFAGAKRESGIFPEGAIELHKETKPK